MFRLFNPSTVIDKPASLPLPLNDLAQVNSPAALNRSMKTFWMPVAVKFEIPTPGSESNVPEKLPMMYTFPVASNAMLFPLAVPVETAHTKFPDPSNLLT